MPRTATKTRKASAQTVEKPDPIRAKDLADALADGLLFAGKDYTLPVLHGIRLEADGTELTIVATDRYAIGVRTVPLPSEPFTCLLKYDDTRDLIGLLKSRNHTHKRGPEVELAVSEPNGPGNGQMITIKTASLTVEYLGGEGEYPKWRDLTAKMKANTAKDTVGTCALNARFLALFARVSEVGPITPLRMKTTASNEAVTFSAGRFWGALMPIRLSEDTSSLAA